MSLVLRFIISQLVFSFFRRNTFLIFFRRPICLRQSLFRCLCLLSINSRHIKELPLRIQSSTGVSLVVFNTWPSLEQIALLLSTMSISIYASSSGFLLVSSEADITISMTQFRFWSSIVSLHSLHSCYIFRCGLGRLARQSLFN